MVNVQSRPLSAGPETSAAARSRCYTLFAEAFRYPDEDFRRQARAGELVQALDLLTAGLPYAFSLEDGEREAIRLSQRASDEDVEVEFVRLFEAGPGGPPCPLVEGAFQEDRRVILKELILFYNHFGLSYAEGAQDERPDHLCLEMEFLHYLTFKEVHALQQGADPSAYRRAQRDFLERHPGQWVPRIAERLEAIWARLPEDVAVDVIRFYRELVRVLGRFLEQERLHVLSLLGNSTG